MNVLLLDNTDETLLQSLNDYPDVTVITGSIQRPKLDPLPDLVIVNFDAIFGSNRKEENLIAVANTLHSKEIVIIAVSSNWDNGLKRFAKLFGADEFCNPDDITIIRTIINIISATKRLRDSRT